MPILSKILLGLIIVGLAEPELAGFCFYAFWFVCAGVSVWLWGEYKKNHLGR